MSRSPTLAVASVFLQLVPAEVVSGLRRGGNRDLVSGERCV